MSIARLCRLARGALLAVSATAAAWAAHAGLSELTLLSEPSLKPVLTAAAQSFEKQTGQPVALVFVKPQQLFKGADHPPDVVVLPDDLMNKAVQAHYVEPDSRRPIGRAGLALVVRSGAAKPDVSSPEALKQALIDAKSIVYGDPDDNPAGAQVVQLLATLGLSDALKAKTTLAGGVNPMAQVSLGAVDLGLHTLYEALAVPGISVAAPLPDAIQPWRRYALAMAAQAPNASDAKELMAFLTSAAGQQMLQAQGLSAPAP